MTSQTLLANALLHPERRCPPGLRAHNGSDPAVRFDVYRNNVVTSLVAALSDTFPVTRKLVGDAFFAAMARLFIIEHPPTSPLLCDYADGFARFIESFAPAAPLPYLPDMARLERARVDAYHAADAPSLGDEDIAACVSDPQALPDSRVEFHPSAQVVGSDFAIVSLWAAHQGHGDIARVDPFVPEAALVLREDDDASVIPWPSEDRLLRLAARFPVGHRLTAWYDPQHPSTAVIERPERSGGTGLAAAGAILVLAAALA